MRGFAGRKTCVGSRWQFYPGRLRSLSGKVMFYKARTMMNITMKKRRFVTTGWLALSLAALFGLILFAGCATDSASRSDYSDTGNSHAGHNH